MKPTPNAHAETVATNPVASPLIPADEVGAIADKLVEFAVAAAMSAGLVAPKQPVASAAVSAPDFSADTATFMKTRSWRARSGPPDVAAAAAGCANNFFSFAEMTRNSALPLNPVHNKHVWATATGGGLVCHSWGIDLHSGAADSDGSDQCTLTNGQLAMMRMTNCLPSQFCKTSGCCGIARNSELTVAFALSRKASSAIEPFLVCPGGNDHWALDVKASAGRLLGSTHTSRARKYAAECKLGTGELSGFFGTGGVKSSRVRTNFRRGRFCDACKQKGPTKTRGVGCKRALLRQWALQTTMRGAVRSKRK